MSWGQRLQLLMLLLRAPKQRPTQLLPPEQALQQLQQLSQGIAPEGLGLPPERLHGTIEALSKVTHPPNCTPGPACEASSTCMG